MQTIHVSDKTGKDGTLLLRIPLGKPEAEYDVVLVVQPKEPPTAQDPWAVVNAIREELARSGREFPDSTPLIREDRDR